MCRAIFTFRSGKYRFKQAALTVEEIGLSMYKVLASFLNKLFNQQMSISRSIWLKTINYILEKVNSENKFFPKVPK